MTRPLDDLLRDVDAARSFIEVQADHARAFHLDTEVGLCCAVVVLRECRAALQTAREDGAREEREAAAEWIRAQAAMNRGAANYESAFACDSIANAIAAGKHRQEKP